MCDNAPAGLARVSDGGEGAPARRLSRLAARACLVGFGTLLAIPLGLVLFCLVWQWRLNRNPDPFPWRPEREWTLSNMSTSWDFVEEDGSLIMLRWDYRSDRSYPPVPSVVRCDVETGRILSEGALPFPATALAVSSRSESLLILEVPPAPHDSIPRPVRQGPDERLPLRRHVLRMARLRLPDWAVEAEIEDEVEYTGSSYELGYSLHAVAMPSRQAWVVGVGGPHEDEYRVSLRDEKTLAEIESRLVPSLQNSLYRGIAVDTENPSRILIGREDWDRYRWDSWDTDSGEVTFTKVAQGNGLPPSPCGPGWRFGLLDGVGLSDFVVRGVIINAISPEGVFAASAMNSKSRASMPVPLPPMRTDLAIWSLAPEKLIVAGKLQGEANAITAIRFSRDNRFLVTGHQGGVIRVWKLPTPEP
jgi:WD40 repeat protein